MSIKKLLVLAAAGVASSAALAGTMGYTSASAPAMYDNTGVYIEGMAGYNRYVLEDAFGTSNGAATWDKGNGNFAFGADIGYQFHRYFSAELGGIYTLKAKETYNGATSDIKLWAAYFAGKVSVPIYDNVSVFAKLGVGYQDLKVDAGAFLANEENNWGAMYGAGIAYNFTPAFYIDGQWLRFTGKNTNAQTVITAPNIFLLGVGYKFAM
jgi:OOP family OmpA-OmpF porin